MFYFNVISLMLSVLDEVVEGMSVNFAGVSVGAGDGALSVDFGRQMEEGGGQAQGRGGESSGQDLGWMGSVSGSWTLLLPAWLPLVSGTDAAWWQSSIGASGLGSARLTPLSALPPPDPDPQPPLVQHNVKLQLTYLDLLAAAAASSSSQGGQAGSPGAKLVPTA